MLRLPLLEFQLGPAAAGNRRPVVVTAMQPETGAHILVSKRCQRQRRRREVSHSRCVLLSCARCLFANVNVTHPEGRDPSLFWDREDLLEMKAHEVTLLFSKTSKVVKVIPSDVQYVFLKLK